ncbi:hypothetical protein Pla52o_19980 [Novipirellula galeiformis]|uniref:Uncharacterized protein n=1 Tax=Novipirellula galeiformis TaxID=2528004 RepID=A0A5C6CIW6_9BACT|nr:hypothetical protein [Novipirellula galeiformis]TWU24075.1 hypothetical protein Pla52o_19980 [Novipirellula galeiformis]
MLHSIKQAIARYCAPAHDIRERDAMSISLHDCIRLIEQHQQTESNCPD